MQKEIISTYSPKSLEMHKQFHLFSDQVKERGLKFFCEVMPAKIFELEEVLKLPLFSNQIESPEINGEDKKRKIEAISNDTATLLSKRNDDLLAFLKKEILELVEICQSIKLWIQLSIPKIEDGNNFGVSIQEEVVTELSRAEESGFLLLDNVSKYYHARAKLITKVEKHPNNKDYQKSVHELDDKHWKHLKVCGVDLRNNYAILYDTIQKNIEKIMKPRSSNTNSMY